MLWYYVLDRYQLILCISLQETSHRTQEHEVQLAARLTENQLVEELPKLISKLSQDGESDSVKESGDSKESGNPESGNSESGNPESGNPESGSPENGGNPESGNPESGNPESGNPENGGNTG